MATSTYTQYYDLSQFQPEDTPDWLSDYNSDMQKIDNSLHDLSQQTEPLTKDLEALTTRVAREEAQSTLQGNQIVDLQQAINANNTNVANMQSQVNNAVANVQTLNVLVEANIDQTGNNANKIADLQADVTNLDNLTKAHAASIATLQTDVGAAQQTADGVKAQLQDFDNVEVTDFAPATNWTSNTWVASGNLQIPLKAQLTTTFHNTRRLTCYNAIQVHDVAGTASHSVIVDGVEYTYGILATCSGKLFNPDGPGLFAPGKVMPIGDGWLCRGAIVTNGNFETINRVGDTQAYIMLGLAYDSATDATYLVSIPPDLTTGITLPDTTQTGDYLWCDCSFIAD